MSESKTLKVVKRERTGKGAAREARRNGLIPAVIYGDKKDPISISIDYNQAFNELRTGHFLTQVYDLEVDGQTIQVIPKDFQVDVVKDLPLHVDFLRLTKGAKISVEIPVEFLNEDICPGLKMGGALNVVRHTIELACAPNAIPEVIQVDLGEVEIGTSIKVSELTLPENTELTLTDRDFTICSVVGRGAEKAEDEETDEVEGGEEEGGEEETSE